MEWSVQKMRDMWGNLKFNWLSNHCNISDLHIKINYNVKIHRIRFQPISNHLLCFADFISMKICILKI